MIDYEKLKIAHELAGKHKDYYFTVEFGAFNPEIWLCQDGEAIHCVDNFDDLIERLTPERKPKPKYRVGQLVYGVDTTNEIKSFVIEEVSKSGAMNFYSDGTYDWHEDLLYPQRQALIESQIAYWQSLSECKPYIAKCDSPLTDEQKKIWQTPSTVKVRGELSEFDCHHESMTPFTKNNTHMCRKCNEEFVPECQHESNGNKYLAEWNMDKEPSIQLKCTKCGEFYR